MDLYWAVKAVDAPDGASWSKVRSFRIAPPAPTIEVVDDLDPGFTRRGKGWHSAANGYQGHLYWAYASGARAARSGQWQSTLVSGRYRVTVYVPDAHATTRSARYVIAHAAGTSTVELNQAIYRGQWVTLGTWEFGRTGTVRLNSATGEASSAKREIAFDAIRFEPATIESAVVAIARQGRSVEPGPESTAKPEPGPESTAKPEPGPESTAKPEPGPESTAKPEPGPESTAKPEPGPESTAKPEPGPESTAKPDEPSTEEQPAND